MAGIKFIRPFRFVIEENVLNQYLIQLLIS